MKLQSLAFAGALLIASSAARAADAGSAFGACEADAYKILGVKTQQTYTLDYLDQKYEAVRACMIGRGFKPNMEFIQKTNIDVAVTMGAYAPENSIFGSKTNTFEQELRMRSAMRLLTPNMWQ